MRLKVTIMKSMELNVQNTLYYGTKIAIKFFNVFLIVLDVVRYNETYDG